MNEQDRTSIHEAMEQQTISVSKAGIVTSLHARCAVLAAANPVGGRYDPSYTLAENVELTDPILQRFDVLCVLQDIVDPLIDQQLASFVVNSHMRSHPDGTAPECAADEIEYDEDGPILGAGDEKGNALRGMGMELTGSVPNMYLDDGPAPLEQEMLKKYILYARTFVKPIIQSVNSEKIKCLYADLRQQSESSGGVPIAARHLDSIMRMSEAFARMHLRDHVRDDDVDKAIKVMLESFLQAQKVAVRKSLQRKFRKYITFGEENNQLLMHQLQILIRDQERYLAMTQSRSKEGELQNVEVVEVFVTDLVARAQELNIHDMQPFYNSALFRNHGLSVDQSRGVIVKRFN